MALSPFFQITCLLVAAGGLAGCIQPINVGSDGGSGGGTGSTGSAGQAPCEVGEAQSCYDGPDGSKDVGLCKAGLRTCRADGVFGACVGQVLPDFERCGAGVDASCDGSTECGPPTGWATPFDPEEPDFSWFTAAAVGPDHHLYLAGVRHQSGSPMVLPGGGTTVFLMDVTPAGEVEWVREYDSLDSYISGLAVDDAGDLLVAGLVGDHVDFDGGVIEAAGFDPGDPTRLFAGKLDAAGQAIWMLAFDVRGPYPNLLLAADRAGSMVLYGPFDDKISFGAAFLESESSQGQNDAFLVKVDPDGRVVFARKQSNAPSALAVLAPRTVHVDAAGGILTTGQFDGDLDVGGPAPLHASMKSGPAIPTGTFLARYDAAGELVWQKGFDGPWMQAVGMSPSGDVAAVGPLRLDTDFGGGALVAEDPQLTAFLVRWDASGQHVASRAFHAGSAWFGGMSVRDDGVATFDAQFSGEMDLSELGGPKTSPVSEGNDVVRLGADDQVTKAWTWHFPEVPEVTFDVTAVDDGVGGVFAYGWYSGVVDLGFGDLPTATTRAFIAHYVP